MLPNNGMTLIITPPNLSIALIIFIFNRNQSTNNTYKLLQLSVELM